MSLPFSLPRQSTILHNRLFSCRCFTSRRGHAHSENNKSFSSVSMGADSCRHHEKRRISALAYRFFLILFHFISTAASQCHSNGRVSAMTAFVSVSSRESLVAVTYITFLNYFAVSSSSLCTQL